MTTPAAASGLPATLSATTYKGQIREITAGQALSTQKRTAAMLGDSFEASEDKQVAYQSGYRGTWTWMNRVLGNYFDIVKYDNDGSGENMSDIRARLDTQIYALDPLPGFVFMCAASSNDIVQERTAAAIFADTEFICNKLISDGIIPIVRPLSEDGFKYSAPLVELRFRITTEFNNLFQYYAEQTPGIIYLTKCWDGMIDQDYSNASAEYVPGWFANLWEGTSLHINMEGGLQSGKNCAGQISQLLPSANNLPLHDRNLTAGAVNPMMLETDTTDYPAGINYAGTITPTGTVAEGYMARHWGSAGSMVNSLVPRTDVSGNWQKAVIDFGNTANGKALFYENEGPGTFSYGAIWHTLTRYGFAVGDTIKFYFETKVENIIGNIIAPQIQIYMSTSVPATVDTLIACNPSSTSSPFVNDTGIVVLESLPYVISATVTQWRCVMQISANSTAVQSNCDWYVGRVGVRKLA